MVFNCSDSLDNYSILNWFNFEIMCKLWANENKKSLQSLESLVIISDLDWIRTFCPNPYVYCLPASIYKMVKQ